MQSLYGAIANYKLKRNYGGKYKQSLSKSSSVD